MFSGAALKLLKRLGSILLVAGLLFLPPTPARAQDGTIFTLWPLIDYRHSPAVDVTTLHLLGPLLTYKHLSGERSYGLRPLYYHTVDDQSGGTTSDYLYPVATSRSEEGGTVFQGVHLLNYDFGSADSGSDDKFNLFPFIFYGRAPDHGHYFAVFPLGGTIYDLLGKDKISFALFPLYGQTRRKGTTVTNILWPFFARIHGEHETGLKLWPLFGYSQKTGVYRKRMMLWPIFFSSDLRLNTPNPIRKRTVFPLYVGTDSPVYSSHTYLWPFFNHVEDRRKDYEQWDFPWPIFSLSRGSYKSGIRLLPFYADEHTGDNRKRWFLWPLYKIEESHTSVYDRRRDRILWFLFSDLNEQVKDETLPRVHRVALWPLFTYEEKDGVSHFDTLSILEPFFPENTSIANDWGPLYHIYVHNWDRNGNEATSFLWNLYWSEQRRSDSAMELFPFFSYRHEKKKGTDFKLLKGLVDYRSGRGGKKLSFLYLPWGFHWGGAHVAAEGK